MSLYAAILRQATLEEPPGQALFAGDRPAIGVSCKLSVNCRVWESAKPQTAGEAESINNDARRIVELAQKAI